MYVVRGLGERDGKEVNNYLKDQQVLIKYSKGEKEFEVCKGRNTICFKED